MRHRATAFLCALIFSPVISLVAATTQDGGVEAAPLTVSTRFLFELIRGVKKAKA